MRETFPHKSEGDTLGAGHVNKLNAAARAVMSLMPGSYTLGQGHKSAVTRPFEQRLVIVVEVEALSEESSQSAGSSQSSSSGIGTAFETIVHSVRPLFYDHDRTLWRINTDADIIDLDTGPLSYTPQIDEVLVAWFDPQREAYIPIPLPRPNKQGTVKGLAPADGALTGQSVVMAVYSKDKNGNMVNTGETITAVVRFTEFNQITTPPDGEVWAYAIWMDDEGEYAIIAIDCAETNLEVSSASSQS